MSEARRRAIDNYNAKRRITTASKFWKCVQCWSEIRWTTRGGNRLTICKDCAPTDRWRALVRRYGVDRNMWEAMYFDQDGECAIESCTREAKSVDHDHITGRVRGLLCQGCNVAVGFLESHTWVNDAQEYLAQTS